jgi:hypothetical protein
MISPGRYDLSADRWVACIRVFSFVALDFTGATFLSDVRLKPDASGAPLIHLVNAAANAEGLALLGAYTSTVQAHIDAGRLSEVPPGYALGDTVTVSQVQLRINETSMEALPYPGERGEDATLYWDLHVTPTGGTKDKYLGGLFICRAGVTQ